MYHDTLLDRMEEELPEFIESDMIHFALVFKNGSICRMYDVEDAADIDYYGDPVEGLVITEGYEDASDVDIYDAYICQVSSLKKYYS